MTNFGYLILTCLCVQYSWGIEKTEIPPIMEPYNQTHCKIFYENAFDVLPKEEFQAQLGAVDENTGRIWVKTIQDNLVKFQSCDVKL